MGRKIQKGDLVEITAIHKKDCFYSQRKNIIGEQATVLMIDESTQVREGRYKLLELSNAWFFVAAKVKLIKPTDIA